MEPLVQQQNFCKYFIYLQLLSQQFNHCAGELWAQQYSGISDLNAKTDWGNSSEYQSFHKSRRQLFVQYFSPATTSNKLSKTGTVPTLKPDSIPTTNSSQLAFYISDEIKLNEKLSANLGLRVPVFLSSKANYSAVEPRATLKYSLNTTSSLKVSYTEMNQFLHLVPSSTASLPTDIWISSSNVVKPEISHQYSLGLFKNFDNNAIETSVEAYYKTMKNQVLLKKEHNLQQT